MGRRKRTPPPKPAAESGDARSAAAELGKAALVPGPPKPPATDPVDILFGEIRQLLEAEGGESLDAAVAAGEHLLTVRGLLPVGTWEQRVEEELHVTARTARRMIQLLRFHDLHPQLYKKLRPLGASRALQIIEHPLPLIEQVVTQKHVVPGKGYVKAPAQLGVRELWAVINLLAGKKAKVDKMHLGKLRRAAKDLRKALEVLVATDADIDVDDLVDIQDAVNDALDTTIAHYRRSQR